MRLTQAVAALEGSLIADEAHESVTFEYGTEKSDKNRTYEFDLSQKLETKFNDETCYYVPVFSIGDEGERSLRRVILIASDAKIVTGEQIDFIATMAPRKDKLTDEIWQENKSAIRKRQGVMGSVAAGGAVFVGAGVVVGTIGIRKWVNKRK